MRNRGFLSLMFIVALCSAASAAYAQTAPKKAPWEWTAEERIKARTDPAQMRKRVLAKGPYPRPSHIRPDANWTPPVDVIDGKRNPELFLPEELFETMILHGYVGDLWRDSYAEPMRKEGLPADLWETLEAAIPEYIDDVQRRDDLYQQRKTAQGAELARLNARVAAGTTALCRHRSEALATARRIYGVALDRFLYNYIAACKGSSGHTPDDPRDLYAMAGGCR